MIPYIYGVVFVHKSYIMKADSSTIKFLLVSHMDYTFKTYYLIYIVHGVKLHQSVWDEYYQV